MEASIHVTPEILIPMGVLALAMLSLGLLLLRNYLRRAREIRENRPF